MANPNPRPGNDRPRPAAQPRPHQTAIEGLQPRRQRRAGLLRCNTDKGSLSLGQWLTRLSRAGDARADHVEMFMRLREVPLDFVKVLSSGTDALV
jgi:hypothetical protein